MSTLRLQRFLSQAGIASRRKAEELILNGDVRVNDVLVKELGYKIDPAIDRVSFRGKELGVQKQFFYTLFHKPARVMVTKNDPEKRKTVFDFIPRLDPSVNAVGRLDYDSEGLLLLTNDGELAYRLTHPSYEIEKEYHVGLDSLPSREQLQKLESGILLEEGKTSAAKISVLSRSPEVWISISIHEGKKRQVRRMFETVGSQVKRLIRVRLGSLTLGKLLRGKWRELTEKEVSNLRNQVELK